jgi:hypothetical protein
MRKFALLSAAFALVVVSFYGCDERGITEPSVETNNELISTVAEEGTPSQAPLLSSKGGSAVLPFWASSGNKNTDPSSQFLGTVDNQPLVLRTNGAEALRVTTDGQVGIGTVDPQTPLHVVNGTAFAEMTVEETRAGQAVQLNLKNTGRTWTLLSDADPDHLRIAGAGSGRSPFTILGGSGNVGMGTDDPQAPLHVVNGTPQAELIVQETRAGQAAHVVLRNSTRSWWFTSDASPDEFQITGPSGGLRPFTILGTNGNIGLGTATPSHPLEMGSGAHVTVGGVWTDASSRAYKENIRDLTAAEARTALDGLTPVQFNYKADGDEGYVGFIAEDVPELVATQDRNGLSPMDIVAVLTRVVQQQEERIAELEARIDALQ